MSWSIWAMVGTLVMGCLFMVYVLNMGRNRQKLYGAPALLAEQLGGLDCLYKRKDRRQSFWFGHAWYGGKKQGCDVALTYLFFRRHPQGSDVGRYPGLRLAVNIQRHNAQALDLQRVQAPRSEARSFEAAFQGRYQGAEQLSAQEKKQLWELAKSLNSVRLVSRGALSELELPPELLAQADWVLLHDWVDASYQQKPTEVERRLDVMLQCARTLNRSTA